MVMPFLLICGVTIVAAAVIGRWWILVLPVLFAVFVVVVGSDSPYGVTGTTLRVGLWMTILGLAAAGLIVLRRRLPDLLHRRMRRLLR